MDFRDARLPLADRIGDLLHRLTLPEKVALLHQHQAAVPRLGVAAFRTGTEALHGLAWLGPATVFPQAIGLASSWSPELLRRVGAAVGDETRGFHHKDPSRCGLNVWAPVVNLLRDPRWGRNEEGYAEDPLLTGVLATAYANGLRGDAPGRLKTAPTLKHFLAYNNETRRDTTSSSMPPRVLHEYELPAFRMPIEAGAAVAVMASYNLVNGRPAHLSPLINDELRRWSPDDLLVVSDAQAPSNVVGVQHYYPDHVRSHAALVKAGVDSFTENDDRVGLTIERISAALEQGLLDESDVDTAVRHILALRLRLGEFDGPTDDTEGQVSSAEDPYADLTEAVINCPAHRELAAQAAREGLVLLKNDGLLPLPANPGTVAVVGPLADTLYEDWYSGTLPYGVTVRAGLAERLGGQQVRYAEGVDRVALRIADGGFAGQYLTMDSESDGAAVRAGAATPGESAWLDVDEWGQGVLALRAVANGRYLTVSADGTLVNEALRPGGWVVRETFEALPCGSGTVFKHLADKGFLVVGEDGVVRTDPGAGTVFEVELLVDGVAAAAAAAQGADVVVVVAGNHPMINGRETEDRVDLELPPVQDRLIRAVAAVNPRTVLVLTSSYPYAVDWADAHLPALLWSAHGGQEFGRALAEVLLGDAGPAGRLTQTWYSSGADLPDLLDYDTISADATYLYYRGEPLYPFGHGLTYSPVRYSDLRLSTDSGEADSIEADGIEADGIEADGVVTVTVTVTNEGSRPTDDVVQLYTRQRQSRVKQPLRRLRAFHRVSLEPGVPTEVSFRLAAADLAFWDVTRSRFVVEEAEHTVLVGASSTDIRCTARLAVRGEQIPPRDLSTLTRAADCDEYADAAFVDADPVTGDAVRATGPGAWLCFAGVDLTGASQLSVTLSRLGAGRAAVVARLDDPLDGEALGTVEVQCDGNRYHFVEGRVPISASGVRDVFLVLPEPGVGIRDLSVERVTVERG